MSGEWAASKSMTASASSRLGSTEEEENSVGVGVG